MVTGSVVTTPNELRALLGTESPGLVPTMGALHEGHRSLIARSAAENVVTVVSIFVNPTQFTNPDDLSAYPRRLGEDAEIALASGADVIYTPDASTVYPAGFQTSVDPGPLARLWEGEFRPGHFRGVATVVTILLNAVRPARAYFGEKDYQQLCVVRQMARDLLLPGSIVGCPTVRADDGLALSSRNARLNTAQRVLAGTVPRALFAMRAQSLAGERKTATLAKEGLQLLEQTPEITVEYLAVVHPETLKPLMTLVPGARAIVAVRLGDVRLIDNLDLGE